MVSKRQPTEITAKFRTKVESKTILLLAIVAAWHALMLPALLCAQGTQQQYYNPAAIAALRRQIAATEAQVKAFEAAIADRQQQLAEAPKKIRPAQEQVANAKAKYEASRAAVNNVNTALRNAEEGLRGIKKQRVDAIANEPAYQVALAIMEKAKANADRLRVAAHERLQSDDEYRRLSKTESFYQTRFNVIKEKQQNGEASPSDFLAAVKELEAVQRKREDFLDQQLKNDPAYQHANKLYEEANTKFEALKELLTEKALAHPTIAEFEKTIAQVKAQQREVVKFTAAARSEMIKANAVIARMKRQADTFIAALNRIIRDRDILDRKVNGMVSTLRYLQSLPPRPIGQ